MDVSRFVYELVRATCDVSYYLCIALLVLLGIVLVPFVIMFHFYLILYVVMTIRVKANELWHWIRKE